MLEIGHKATKCAITIYKIRKYDKLKNLNANNVCMISSADRFHKAIPSRTI